MNKIKKIIFIDFDGTLANSPLPEQGKVIWEKKKKEKYPHIGWWGKPESLDTTVFKIDLIPNIEKIVRKGIFDSDTYTVLLSSRMKKLEPSVVTVLNNHNIRFDRIDLKDDNKTKGEKVLDYIGNFPDLETIEVYDDNYEREIISFITIKNKIPNYIDFKIFWVTNGKPAIVESKEDVIKKIIREELNVIRKL
jgi:hypothetical protein